jgi:hypothetical protein
MCELSQLGMKIKCKTDSHNELAVDLDKLLFKNAGGKIDFEKNKHGYILSKAIQ